MLRTHDTLGTTRWLGRPVLIASSALLLAWAVTACGGKAPPPEEPQPAATAEPAEPEPDVPLGPETLETGMDCVEATAECEGGVCTADVKNNCDKPVTCNFAMYALCKGTTTGGQARGTARDTFRPGDGGPIQAGANCEGADVPATAVDSLECSSELVGGEEDEPKPEGDSGSGDGGAK